MRLLLALILLAISGCARFRCVQSHNVYTQTVYAQQQGRTLTANVVNVPYAVCDKWERVNP